MLESYVNKIFNKIDGELLEYLDDDGMQIEPKYYLPIIPMILVNGAEGIGTGFSTFIPNYNPVDIIDWLINKLEGKTTKSNLVPYYKNFKGKIIKYDDNTWVSEGIIEIDEKKNELIIKELPLKMWTNDYKEWLEDFIYEQKNELFKSYNNLSSDIEARFVLKFDSDNFNKINEMSQSYDSDKLNVLLKYLKLYKTIKQSNMNLYNYDYQIKTYKNPEEIIEEFYKWRLGFYDKRKELLLENINKEIKLVSNQINFIELVIESDGKIFKLDENQMNKFLESKKIIQINKSYDYLTNMTFKQLTKINLEKLENKLKEFKAEYKKISLLTNKEIWLNDLNLLKSAIRL
jgi:DNA topoisomerase-2